MSNQTILLIGGRLDNTQLANQILKIKIENNAATDAIVTQSDYLQTVSSSIVAATATAAAEPSPATTTDLSETKDAEGNKQDDTNYEPSHLCHCRAVSLLAQEPKTVSPHTIVVTGGRHFVLSGIADTAENTEEMTSKEVWIRDPETEKWRKGPSMLNARQGHGFCALDPWTVYAVGGDTSGRTAEFLDIREPVWRRLPRTRKCHFWTRLVAIKDAIDSLYIVGGESAFVEHFQIGAGRWDSLPEMQNIRTYHSVCEHKGIIYAIGGLTASCESYSPDDGWQPICSMPHIRDSGEIVMHGNRLMLLGGKNGEGKYCTDAFIYNLTYDNWEQQTLQLTDPNTQEATPLTLSYFGLANLLTQS